MKLKYLLLTLPILFWVGCEDKDASGDSDAVESVSGNYSLTSATSHPEGDCSAAGGVAGTCITDSTATTEADCPTGMCMDGSGADEASCTEGMWLIGMCLDDDGNGVEDESVQASSDACTTAGYQWMAMGWMNLIDAFGNWDSSPIKWWISGNTIRWQQTDGRSSGGTGILYMKGNNLSLVE